MQLYFRNNKWITLEQLRKSEKGVVEKIVDSLETLREKYKAKYGKDVAISMKNNETWINSKL